MKKEIIIFTVIALLAICCKNAKKEQILDSCDTTSSIDDTTYNQTVAVYYTVEDTVRHQIGGKLYGLNFRPSDSITVIKAIHYQIPEEYLVYSDSDITVYREYHFIVHNRYSYAHRYFETSALDSIRNVYMTHDGYWDIYKDFLQQQNDSVQSKYLNPSLKDLNGYWIYLKEHNSNYYLNDDWSWHSTFRITDSIFISHYMDGYHPQKIIEAISLPKNGISILRYGDEEPIKIEMLDKSKSVYRFINEKQIYYITPAKAIHNFEIIQYTNNTGDLM